MALKNNAKNTIVEGHEHATYRTIKSIVYIKRLVKGQCFTKKILGMDMYPNDKLCPSNCFNLWKPFKITTIKSVP